MFSFSRVKVAIRFFFVGLAIGVLLAPRSGIATRRMLRERADRLFNDLLDAATLGAYDPADGEALNEDDATGPADEPAPRQRRAAASAQS
ncbi:MAG: YtxH domain-containing protein [Chloroflexota bacterium]